MEKRPEDRQPVARIAIVAEELSRKEPLGIVSSQLDRIDHVPAIGSLNSFHGFFFDLLQGDFSRHLRQPILEPPEPHVELTYLAA